LLLTSQLPELARAAIPAKPSCLRNQSQLQKVFAMAFAFAFAHDPKPTNNQGLPAKHPIGTMRSRGLSRLARSIGLEAMAHSGRYSKLMAPKE